MVRPSFETIVQKIYPLYSNGPSLASGYQYHTFSSRYALRMQTRLCSSRSSGSDETRDLFTDKASPREIERLPMPPGVTADKFGLYEILDSSQDWRKISGLNAVVAAHGPENLWVPEGTNNEGAGGGIFGVIAAGGTQHKVMAGDVLYTMRLKGDVNELFTFREVLAIGAYDWSVIGRPLIRGAVVTATIEEQTLSGKIIVAKFKKRKGYRRRQGHRQPITRLRIEEVKYEFPDAAKIVPYKVKFDPNRPPLPNHSRKVL